MFLKNVSKTFQNFAYNDGKRQRQIAPGETVALIDAKEDDTAIRTLVSLGYVEIVDGEKPKAAKEQETVADLIDAGDTEVLTTVHCPGVFKNGNPCNAVVQLAEGERYEDAPRFCGRHKDENPDDYELIDGKWTKTGAAAKKANGKAAKKPAEAPVKPAEAGNAEGEGSDASKPAEAATSPLAPADARPVFDNE